LTELAIDLAVSILSHDWILSIAICSMTKVIYSLYIDIPKDELDPQPAYHGDTISKTLRTKERMSDYYVWLRKRQEEYAESIGVEYKLFQYDNQYLEFKETFADKPYITTYNIINFYKIHLMYELAKTYDEILYLDFDVVPLKNECFFERWKLKQNGMAILSNRKYINISLHKMMLDREFHEEFGANPTYTSNRSPTAKYWNCRALLTENDMSGANDVYNTGIVGITKDQLKQLNYFENFDELLLEMKGLKEDPFSMYPPHITDLFGYDNETIWSFKARMNNVTAQLLDSEWHQFMDKISFVSKKTKLVHVINKDFAYVKDWYEKNNI
jgi:hypothetical protein